MCDAGKDDSGGRGEKGSYLVAGVGVPDEEFGAGEDVGGREVGLLFVQRGGGVHSGGGRGIGHDVLPAVFDTSKEAPSRLHLCDYM